MNSSKECCKKKSFNDSSKIYRIIPFPRIVELLGKKRNTLVKPCKWKDPLEGWLRNEILRLYNEGSRTEYGDFFGQCWTTDYSSELMWNMYSKGTNGFRIKSTVGKIKCSLKTLRKGEYWYISPINYQDFSKLESYHQCELKDMCSNNERQDPRFWLAQSYMIKREGYKSEHEVRLICNRSKTSDEFFDYPICPNFMIDQIMMHPDMSDNDYGYFKKFFSKFLGFKGEIKKSVLYKNPASISGLKWIPHPSADPP